jgi:hypothetical protein
MRRSLTFAILLLPLAGCYAPPPADGYGYGYQQPAYQPVPYAEPQDAYPGYDYNDGSPYLTVDGAAMPLIFFGGFWGYNDSYGHFHRAPDRVGRNLESRFPHGQGFQPRGGGWRAPPPRQGWQGGGGGGGPPPRFEQRPAPAAAPPPHFAAPQPHYAAPAAAPPPRFAAPAFRQEEHRGREERHCPPGQSRC